MTPVQLTSGAWWLAYGYPLVGLAFVVIVFVIGVVTVLRRFGDPFDVFMLTVVVALVSLIGGLIWPLVVLALVVTAAARGLPALYWWAMVRRGRARATPPRPGGRIDWP